SSPVHGGGVAEGDGGGSAKYGTKGSPPGLLRSRSPGKRGEKELATKRRRGGQPGNNNARKHGRYAARGTALRRWIAEFLRRVRGGIAWGKYWLMRFELEEAGFLGTNAGTDLARAPLVAREPRATAVGARVPPAIPRLRLRLLSLAYSRAAACASV